MLAHSGIHILQHRLELAGGAEHDVLRTALGVPVGETVAKQAAMPLGLKTRGELVAIAELIPVVSSFVPKADAGFIAILAII